MDSWVIGTFIVGFFFSFVLTRLLIRLAPRLELIDHPDVRKQHVTPTPQIGGLAMFISLLLTVLIAYPVEQLPFKPLLLAFLIVTLGVLDDRFNLSALPRLGLQAMLALVMVQWAGVELNVIGDLTFNGVIVLGALALPMTVIGTVGVINAVNFSDGLDGLAAGLVLVAVGFLALLSQIAGNASLTLELLLLMGVLLGFWVMNARFIRRKSAAAFMGDAGSMLLGFLLAWYFISLSQGEAAIISPVTALWLFALPLFDTVGIMLRRIIRGRSPFAADREHLHHIFIHAGYSVCKTVSLMLLIAIVLGLVGFMGEVLGIHEGVMFWGFMFTFAGYFFVMMHAWKAMKWVKAH